MDYLIKACLIYYVIINIVLFGAMGIDKYKAKKDLWRIKEATLMILALMGGAGGGFLGMKIFHHKSRKWYFYVVFAAGIILHIALWWLIGVRFHA